MIIHVEQTRIELREPDDLARFAVVSPLTAGQVAARLSEQGWGGGAAEPGHVTVAIAAVREAVRDAGRASEAWDAAFSRMLSYAGVKGWLVGEHHILAHVESA